MRAAPQQGFLAIFLTISTACASSQDQGQGPSAAHTDGFAACGGNDSGSFCDNSAALGVSEERLNDEHEGPNGTVTSADFDGDGRLDLLVHYDGALAPTLWLRTDAGFVERSRAWGIDEARWVVASASADLDGDGDPDLLLRQRQTVGVRLYRNTGQRFELVTSLGDDAEFSVLVPVDLDRDGRLDLTFGAEARPGSCGLPFISGCPAGVTAWRQVEPWRFEPVRVEAAPRRVLAMRWHDLDNDGVDELLVIADFGMLNGGNQLLRADGAGPSLTLREVPTPPGFGVEVFGMGVAPIDVDRDGRDELLVTNFGRNVLLRERDGRWSDIAREAGADLYGIEPEGSPMEWGHLDAEHRWMGPLSGFQSRYLDPSSGLAPTTKWTPLVFDYDLDGIDDVYVGASSVGLSALFPEAALQSGAMLRGDGVGLRDVTRELRLFERLGVAHPAAVDLDRDGDLDLALPRTPFPGHPGGLRVLRNDAATGRSLWVEARGLGGASDGIGARVSVVVGGRTISRRLDGNRSIGGSGPHGVLVGMGRRERVERVEVRFVSGALRVLEDVPAGRLVVRE